MGSLRQALAASLADQRPRSPRQSPLKRQKTDGASPAMPVRESPRKNKGTPKKPPGPPPPSAEELEKQAEALRERWGVKRTWCDKDSWRTAVTTLDEAGIKIQNRDVPHTGCCKGYSLATVLVPELGAFETAKPPSRTTMDKHVRLFRAELAKDVDAEEFERLCSLANTNYGDWCKATDLEDARERVAMSFDAALTIGHSMSPVWLEEWETSRIAHRQNVVVLELHDACASNRGRSHYQVITPSPNHTLRPTDELVVLKRIQCHYNPVRPLRPAPLRRALPDARVRVCASRSGSMASLGRGCGICRRRS